ncbi:hypothetical protein HU200_028724 [Digitaria exilis]|uniref:60S ribosomal protein L34 n=1 Tax=Digitaria exilis TaxID=1010633 RepID=A0A835C068_9POAL|nr:hypothetical protein HU200_028724 [Digitaria exilis]
MVQRLTYRKRHSYATKSNQTRVVKTPGKIVVADRAFVSAFLWVGVIWLSAEYGLVLIMFAVRKWMDLPVGFSILVVRCGRLVYQYTKKRASGPKCPVTGKKIHGIPHLRPTEYKRSRLPRNRRTVNRPYGGVLSGTAVRERIIRAFLVEEQKIVKKVLKIQKTKDKASKS